MEILKIEGMRCGACVAAVTKALEAIEGVSEVVVDLDNNEARFKAEDVSQDVLQQAIVAIGFDVIA